MEEIVSPPITIIEILKARAKNEPDVEGFYFLADENKDRVPLTYRELHDQALSIASVLLKTMKKGERAILLYPPGPEFIAAFFGCLYAGIIAVPAYPPGKSQNLNRLKSIIDDASASCVLTEQGIYRQSKKDFSKDVCLKNIPWLCTDNMVDDEVLRDDDLSVIAADDIALLQYTSGSTGSPKGVIVSHCNIMNNQMVMEQALSADRDSVSISWLPHFHDMGLMQGVIQPVYVGFPVTLMPPAFFSQKPIRWLRAISKYQATISGAPNFAYDLCVDTIKDEELSTLDLGGWKLAFNGAEPVISRTLERFYQKFKACGYKRNVHFPCYGMAETTLFASGSEMEALPVLKDVDKHDFERGELKPATNKNNAQTLVSSGYSRCGHKVAIVNPDNRQQCADGEVGEIWIKGESVAQGYWGKTTESEEIFNAYIDGTEDGPYLRTGDLGSRDKTDLYVTGRKKDVLIFRGRNIYPQDLEQTAAASNEGLVSHGCIAISVNDKGAEKLVLVQEVKRSYVRKIDPYEVYQQIKNAIAREFELHIHDIVLVKPNRLLRTSSGKVQRQANRQAYINDEYDSIHQLSKAESSVGASSTGESSTDEGSVDERKPSTDINIVRQWLARRVAQLSGMPESYIDWDVEFTALGLDSVDAIALTGEFSSEFNVDVSAMQLYDFPTINKLSEIFETGTAAPAKEKTESIDNTNKIAIIGLSCRFPGADSVTEYWDRISQGNNAITRIPGNRFEQKDNPYKGGYLNNIADFDTALFSISPKEAISIDPQHRLLLEQSYDALLSAGYQPEELAGTRTGVFIGMGQNDYGRLCLNDDGRETPYFSTGNALSIAASRLAYYYDFKGPCMVIDTACSSSLVAVDNAVRCLRSGDIDMAVVGGVQLNLLPAITRSLDGANMLAADGHCKVFDSSADGYVRSEGCAVVILKRLGQALSDGDSVSAVIAGCAVGQDGRSNGLNAPNGLAQQEVIGKALSDAGVNAGDVSYVEAHGTGTELGDPIELRAIGAAYHTAQRPEPLTVGAVKANIGHLEAAAGMAGLIKTILCLENQAIPPQIHFNTPNPHIDWSSLNIHIPLETVQWGGAQKLRRAGVSSFGFGGTNAHVILEQSPSMLSPADNKSDTETAGVLALSAKTAGAARQLLENYSLFLQQQDKHSITDICYSSCVSRQSLPHRMAIDYKNKKDLLNKIQQGVSIQGEADSHKNIAFIFTGQGSQYPNMSAQLFETQTVFRKTVLNCADILKKYLDFPIIDSIYPDQAASSWDSIDLNDTACTQPALFVVEYSLARLWMSWGIMPTHVMGHSVGEIVAATIAGVLTLDDALKLVASRGRLIQRLPGRGKMLAVNAGVMDVTPLIAEYLSSVSIAAVNGPASVVISGDENAIDMIKGMLDVRKIAHKPLLVSHAFHSPMMWPMVEDFEQVLDGISFKRPEINIIDAQSSQINSADISSPQYWSDHVVESVQFYDTITALYKNGCRLFLEIGPSPQLCSMGQECIDDKAVQWLPSLRRGVDDNTQMLNSLAHLYVNGVDIDWENVYREQQCQRVSIPGYPFQREPYWVSTPTTVAPMSKPAEGAGGGVGESVGKRAAAIASQEALGHSSGDEELIDCLKGYLAQCLQTTPDNIDTDAPLLELGADSLIIVQFARRVEAKYGLTFKVSQFFKELSTLSQLAGYIQLHSSRLTVKAPDNEILVPPSEPLPIATPSLTVSPSTPSASSREIDDTDSLTRLFDLQLHYACEAKSLYAVDALSAVTEKQLGYFQPGAALKQIASRELPESNARSDFSGKESVATDRASLRSSGSVLSPSPLTKSLVTPLTTSLPTSPLPPWQLNPTAGGALSEPQQQHLNRLIHRYTEKTASSKSLTQKYRSVCADSRAAAGFRLSTKEMLYPLFGERAEGAYTWDVDGNQYIDITMGFGVNLFGHQPAFIVDAINKQLSKSIQLGLQNELSGQVAELICELTGMSRVTFCNTGTEAVMTALRLARSATGRSKIVQFTGAYHGHFDGTLVDVLDQQGGVVPAAPGVSSGAVEDVILWSMAVRHRWSLLAARAMTLRRCW